MFATCHLTYGQLSNFVRASLEVTRTIRNNKVHFTWGCSILLLKKEMVPETGYLFFQWFWHFINCLNSNHNTLSNELFSKFLSWFLYLSANLGQLSNFVRARLEVTRTIRNNKLHFTCGCSILLLKKKEKGPETKFLIFFFQWFWQSFKVLKF